MKTNAGFIFIVNIIDKLIYNYYDYYDILHFNFIFFFEVKLQIANIFASSKRFFFVFALLLLLKYVESKQTKKKWKTKRDKNVQTSFTVLFTFTLTCHIYLLSRICIQFKNIILFSNLSFSSSCHVFTQYFSFIFL